LSFILIGPNKIGPHRGPNLFKDQPYNVAESENQFQSYLEDTGMIWLKVKIIFLYDMAEGKRIES
jgi:hypothetical protein